MNDHCMCGSATQGGVCCRSGNKVEPEPVEDLEDDAHQPGAPKQPADCRHEWKRTEHRTISCVAGCGARVPISEFTENACYVQGDC